MKKYVCTVCGYIYDEAAGYPAGEIAPDTTWEADVSRLLSMLHEDLESGYPAANEAAGVKPDRGALRALVWGEKVSRIVNSILQRYEKEGDALLEHTNIYVCDICGFIYIGDTPPALCPVCKVPGWKMTKVERGQAG